jgi:hypothetical protein
MELQLVYGAAIFCGTNSEVEEFLCSNEMAI